MLKGEALVHGARTSARRRHRSARRHLLLRRHAVRAARRAKAVQASPRGRSTSSWKWRTLPPRRLGDLRKGCNPAFVDIVNRCLAKTPSDRFASAAEIRVVLDEWRLAKKASRATTALRLSNFVKRNSEEADRLVRASDSRGSGARQGRLVQGARTEDRRVARERRREALGDPSCCRYAGIQLSKLSAVGAGGRLPAAIDVLHRRGRDPQRGGAFADAAERPHHARAPFRSAGRSRRDGDDGRLEAGGSGSRSPARRIAGSTVRRTRCVRPRRKSPESPVVRVVEAAWARSADPSLPARLTARGGLRSCAWMLRARLVRFMRHGADGATLDAPSARP